MQLVLILQYGSLVWALPHLVATTTSKIPDGLVPEEPMKIFQEPAKRAAATPWSSQVTMSHHIGNRAASTTTIASPTPTATGPILGQIVLASTKQSDLPAAICGFMPYLNGTKSALG